MIPRIGMPVSSTTLNGCEPAIETGITIRLRSLLMGIVARAWGSARSSTRGGGGVVLAFTLAEAHAPPRARRTEPDVQREEPRMREKLAVFMSRPYARSLEPSREVIVRIVLSLDRSLRAVF